MSWKSALMVFSFLRYIRVPVAEYSSGAQLNLGQEEGEPQATVRDIQTLPQARQTNA